MKYDLKPRHCVFDEEGLSYLGSRYLNAAVAHQMRISAYGGMVYFPFFRNGEVFGWKVRSIEEKKDQRSINVCEGEDWPFFGQETPEDSSYLIITEGEFDAIALKELGAKNVVSLPHGSSSVEKSFKSNYKFLQEFDCIYIAFDSDDAGNKAAEKASKLIPANKFRRIIFPEGCKDANDWLIKEIPDADDLSRLMLNSKRIHVPDIVPMYEFKDLISKAIPMGESTGFKGLDNIIGGFRCGEVVVISADTGSGKTTFCTNLISNLAKKGSSVWVNSYEMDIRIVARKIFSVACNKNFRLNEFTEQDESNFTFWSLRNKIYLNPISRGHSIKELRNSVEMAVYAYGIKFVFIDHLDYIKSRGESKNVLENIDEAMREIHQIALEFGVCIILVVHPKQVEAGRELTKNDLKGSSSIKQYADNIIILTRMENIDSSAKKGQVKFNVVKNRLLGKEQFFVMSYNENTDSYSE